MAAYITCFTRIGGSFVMAAPGVGLCQRLGCLDRFGDFKSVLHNTFTRGVPPTQAEGYNLVVLLLSGSLA